MSDQEHITISPVNSESESQNYNFLRETGVNYLQKVVGKIWTDYNVHDPGIQMLEELSYAISDVARRANLDIKDIIAVNEALKKDGGPESLLNNELNNFHTAREILTNAPYTVNDYRKLLIDIPLIKNAWLEKTTDAEIDFFFNKGEKEISFTKIPPSKRIELNGLYEVLLEFDEHEEFGDLNDNTLNYELSFDGHTELGALVIDISAEFQYWSYEWPPGKGWSNLTDIYQSIRGIQLSIESGVQGLEIKLSVSATNIVTVSVADITGVAAIPMVALENDIKSAIDALFDTSGAGDDNLLVKQQNKVKATFEIVDVAKKTLHKNRNLCEDFVRFSALKVEEIILCADIELETDADAEEVLSEIYFQVGQFLSPEVYAYTFSEMLTKGYVTEEIFEGPRLTHGFIDTEELEKSSRMQSVHVSDLINIIMDIDGVVAIRDMEIANIPLGDSSIMSKSAHWCLNLAWEKNFVPRLNSEDSSIKFLKKGVPFIADEDEVEQLLADKKAALVTDESGILEEDLPIPNGDFYQLADYSSIHLDFPENYGVGEIGLPGSASNQRKAQAKQLKAFLLFFDQFLANYCSQLGNIRQVFSMNGDIRNTYFTQTVYDVAGNEMLFQQFADFIELSDNPDNDPSDILALWEDYKENELSYQDAENDLAESESREPVAVSYQDSLNKIVEDDETFYRRRNLFLDHLLARFCEQFTDYAMLAYRLDGKKADQELIDDKVAFLAEYPEISYNRGQGFDYLSPGWNTKNISGLQRRASRLLGIDNYTRRDFACTPVKDQFFKFNSGSKRGFRFKNYDNEILLVSELFDNNAERNAWIDWVLEHGKDDQYYKHDEDEMFFTLVDEADTLIGTSPVFIDVAACKLAMEQMLIMLRGDCRGEGFYLLEHTLLRPRTTSDDFLPVSFEEDCYCVGNEDVYSFRATIVLPYWTERFENMDFRRFVERTLREEAPAHVFLKICWINQDQMALFQEAYKAWLEEMENCPPYQNKLTEKQNALIAILNDLRNVYPVSYLFDCKESDRSPMTLGQSILGTFIPEENE